MEDDDEFGDLYTDVLRPFHPPQPPPPQQPSKQPSPPTRPIDLNIHSDDDEILYGTANPKFNFTTSNQTQTLGFKLEKPPPEPDGSSDSRFNLNLGGTKEEDRKVEKSKGFLAEGVSNWGSDLKEPSVSRVLASGGDVGLESKGFEDPNLMDESGIEVVVEERDGGDDLLVENDVGLMGKKESFEKFDVEEAVIPGLSIPGVSDSGNNRGGGNFATTRDEGSEGDDWDSDSEDDLQIVLNDNSHGAMAMDNRTGVVGSDDEDEDGDPLVIVTDSEQGLLQPMEEQEWGDDAAQVGDGERKELGDAVKVNGGVAIVPKIGFNNHAYHPYHSQFKYVRPGAAPMPGAAPVGPAGAPGQVRPPVNMGPVGGRGRGDWRPTGIKTASPMQKSFHPGFGLPGWGNNTAGRGFGSGLEFTLPSHKTIFEVDIDSFEEKPWKHPGIDISDFFNFGLNEESWKDYCKQLEQLRLEATMQSKIRVYESGRTEQDYDPDLPPELAAAAGIHDISSENANLGKMDAGHSDVSKGSERVRPPLPTGRPIQVETSYAERLPSIDTRPPRIRDSDSIIEIVLQDSADDASSPGNELIEKPENDPSREDFRAGQEIEGDTAEEEHFDGFSQTYNGRKREVVGRRAPFVNPIQDNLAEGAGNLPSSPEAPVQYSPDSRGQTSTYPGRGFGKPHEERQAKGKARDKSPNITRSESTLDKRYHDNQKEDSVESIGGEDRSRLSSPVTVGSVEDPDAEHVDGLHDELVLADGSSKLDREEMGLDKMSATDTRTGENPSPSLKKQKLSSRVEQSSRQEIDVGGDLKAARSSENSKARSGSSRDYQKLHDSVDEEVVQRGHSARMENLKRSHGEDEQSVRRKGRDERHEMEKHRMVEKGREDSYSRRDWDPHWAHHSHVKPETLERRKERENSEGAWQRRDDDPHGRRARPEDARKRERGDEIGSRHRNKVRESEKMDKDEHLQLRKQLDNGYSSGHYDKDMGSRHRERDDNLKGRYENMDDLHSKRRKEEENLRRDTKMEEILHGHRENTSRRKREREDALDLHKRDDQVRARDDDHHSIRHKEETWSHRERSERQRERDEWHRLKQSQEESLLKREREEGRGVRSGRAVEDKARVSHARMKDEYKASDRDYQFKDSVRHNEQIKKRDRIDDGSLSQHKGREDVNARGSQLNNDDRRSRQERASTRSDSVGGSDKNRTHEKKPKESMRKSRDSEGGNQNSLVPSKRNQEDKSGQMNEPVILKGTTDQGNTGREILVNRHSSKKHKEDASSDDELQDSRRGRSKLERWTSHKERDFSINTKSSSSLKVKEIAKSNNGGSSSTNKLPDETSNTVDTIDNQHTLGDQKDASDPDVKNADAKPLEDRHLDTVAKLKKRSERFKLPMPSEKEAMVIKKMENEPLPSATGEALADSEIKPERPARKRRWISN